ncbi:hypothetical protein ACIQTX_12530 [Microbacterium sp. NPDC090281]|uniref:hypothetical protein n=1 Tax=Microbacterium sp. NPDC090281 TaxID=3364208 RepID=UPI00382954D1
MSYRTPAATTALLFGLSAAVLTGCGAPTPGVIEPPAEAQPTLAPSTEPTSGADPAPAATPQCRRPGGDGTISNGEPLNVGLYDGMVDLGPRVGANGTVASADDGSLASYVVASGDYKDAILERLCLGPYSYEALNAVRRGSLHSVDPTNQTYLTPLYAGDTLNLSPYTITSVGDVNGEVHSYETVFILPPQR